MTWSWDPPFGVSSRGGRTDLWFTLVAGLIVLGLATGGAAPLLLKQSRLQRELEELDQKLDRIRPPDGAPSVLQQVEAERERYRRLRSEWEEIQSRLPALHRIPVLESPAGALEGRIDLKIAILKVHDRLDAMAMRRGTLLPAQLGLPETIDIEQRAEIRLGQLGATYEIMKAVIQSGVSFISVAEALEPEGTPPGDSGAPLLVFYPVYLELETSLPAFSKMLGTLAAPVQQSFLRHLYVESAFPERPRELRVRGVWSSVGVSPNLSDPSSGEEDSGEEDPP